MCVSASTKLQPMHDLTATADKVSGILTVRALSIAEMRRHIMYMYSKQGNFNNYHHAHKITVLPYIFYKL